ncbi:hypothetical protein ECEC1862_2135, partial [Escherichia coli EC1862]
PI